MRQILILLLLLPVVVLCQFRPSEQFNIHSGSPYKVIDARQKIYFNLGEEVLMIKMDKKKMFIQKYNVESGKETLRNEFKALDKRDDFEEIVQLQDHLYLFFSRWDKEKQLEQLFYKEIDTGTGKFRKEQKLFHVNGKLSGSLAKTSMFSYKIANKFNFYPSYDESKIVIQYRKKPEIKNDKNSFDLIGMHVFNKALVEDWSSEVKMPYTEAQMNNIDYQVDKNGVSYLLAEVYNPDTPKKYINDKKNYHLELLAFTENGVEKIKINEEAYHFDNVLLFENALGELYLTGLYKESKGRYNEIDGFFHIKIEGNSFAGEGHYHKVPLEIINQFKSQRQQKKNKKKKAKKKLALQNIELRRLISTEDGGSLLIAEEYFVTVHTTTDSRGHTRTRYTYHYKDLLVTKIASSGEMLWMKKLPKAQKGARGRGGMSFTYAERNGKHYFFYVDNLKNMKLSLDKNPVYHSDGAGGIFSVYSVDDETGEVDKSALVNLREVKIKGQKKTQKVYQYNTGRVLESSNGLVFEVYKKGKEDVMIHIDFE